MEPAGIREICCIKNNVICEILRHYLGLFFIFNSNIHLTCGSGHTDVIAEKSTGEDALLGMYERT